MTFQRDDLKKGFERMSVGGWRMNRSFANDTDFDFQKDPPPDLAIEVEMSHSLAGRIHIFAAMKVPEVWRFQWTSSSVCILDADGRVC